MSQPTVDQAQPNGRVGGDSGETTNGLERSDPESAHIDTVHFGIFHDQVRDEVRRLQNGLSVVDGAVTELSKTFDIYGKIVSTVGERYGKDQVLEEKIRGLEATNAGIWKNIEKDRKYYQRDVSNLHDQHKGELSRLRAQADAGELEKKKYEEMVRHLEDQHTKAQQTRDGDLKQKIVQLENENAEKIASLEGENTGLQNENARLKKELNERTIQRDQERETRETMQSKARTEIQKLEKTLTGIKAKYEVEQRPLQFYEDRYKGLIDRVAQVATLHFTDLPEKAIDDPVNTSVRLRRNAPSFARVPIADSECSRVLRLANVQHIVFEAISGSVWQSFFSRYLWKHKRDKSALPEIYSGLAAHGEDVQHNWKVSTLKVLGQFDDKVDVGELVDDLIEQPAIATLQLLLDDNQLDPFKDDLKAVFTEAIELGQIAERDHSPVYLDTTPSMNDRAGWKEYLSDEYDMMGDAANISPISPTSDLTLEPLFVSPKIFRKGKRAAPTATATTSVTATAGREEVEVIQPGVALFPDTGIFQEGVMDWQRIRQAGREVAKNTNGKGRRSSGTGSGIIPRSPLEPSKMWPRQGTQDFD